MAEWFAMGGYASYLWPAYGVSFLTLLGLTVWSWREYTAAKRKVREMGEDLDR